MPGSFTCVQEVRVGDHLRLIIKQQVSLIPLGVLAPSSSTTPKAQQHGAMNKTSEDKKNPKPYVSVQTASSVSILRCFLFFFVGENHNLSSLLGSRVPQPVHCCPFEAFSWAYGLHPPVVMMCLPFRPDNVVTNRHPGCSREAVCHGPLRAASCWKLRLQVFVNRVLPEKPPWD